MGRLTQGALAKPAGAYRCDYAKLLKTRYDISSGVAGRLFSTVDVNTDFKVTAADEDEAAFKSLDKNGNGKVSVCEVFEGFMDALQDAEEKAYLQAVTYADIRFKYRKRGPIFFPGSN
ncbi:uncharacterized protein LOC124290018 [Haliotis rubra]|uniref:uncharacterized protein LOC124290018 n=1 Tax=Haliotis rubra TaxID=36100 RepID=UPI001EE635E3|nr:uncharacterized protein LOC124290018 [Haliotis rubra]